MLVILLFVEIVTLLLALALPLVVRPMLIERGLVDVPNARSMHTEPTVRGLGMATLLAMAGGYLLVISLILGVAGQMPDGMGGEDGLSFGWNSFFVFLTTGVVAIAAGLIGFSEDLRGMSVNLRSLLQLLLAALALTVLILLTDQAWWWLPYGVLFLSSYITVANFMDGINGISGAHGLIAGITFTAAGFLSNQLWLTLAGLILAAAFAGFLPWNFMGAGAFLGDVGSYLLGGAVATISLAAAMTGVPWLAAIAPTIFYFGDVAFTLVKRLSGGHKWHEPHKEHVYERMVDRGYSHVQVTLIVSALTVLACVLGLASFFITGPAWFVLLGGGLALVALYLALPRLLPSRA